LVAHFASRARRRRGADGDGTGRRNGVLFAAGLIAGEALIGIFMAVPIVLTENPDVIALPFDLPAVVGLLVIAVIAAAIYRVASRP
jgi:hypothetical protein